MKRWHCCVLLKVNVKAKVTNCVEFLLDHIFWTAEPIVTKLVMDTSPWARLSCEKTGLLSSTSKSQWRLIIRYDCLYYIYWTSLLFLQSNLIGWYITIFWSVLCKNWIVVFKVKVTVKVQIFIRSLFMSYFLYHWSLGNQTTCSGVLLLLNNQVQRSIYWQ